jgi:glutathione synthase/RimK-type ligase-like ATP-grasp enzyme
VIPFTPATAPAGLLDVALAAANAIGGSLYGIDIKEVDGAFFVIEVNDNPSIDANSEDRANPLIYREIVRYLAGE